MVYRIDDDNDDDGLNVCRNWKPRRIFGLRGARLCHKYIYPRIGAPRVSVPWRRLGIDSNSLAENGRNSDSETFVDMRLRCSSVSEYHSTEVEWWIVWGRQEVRVRAGSGRYFVSQTEIRSVEPRADDALRLHHTAPVRMLRPKMSLRYLSLSLSASFMLTFLKTKLLGLAQ